MTKHIITGGQLDFVQVSARGAGMGVYPTGVPVDLNPAHKQVLEASCTTRCTPDGKKVSVPTFQIADVAPETNRDAYRMADAMLTARANPTQEDVK